MYIKYILNLYKLYIYVEIERCLKVSVIWLLRAVIPIFTDLQMTKLLKQKYMQVTNTQLPPFILSKGSK